MFPDGCSLWAKKFPYCVILLGKGLSAAKERAWPNNKARPVILPLTRIGKIELSAWTPRQAANPIVRGRER